MAPLGAPGEIRASGLIAYKRETALSFAAQGVVDALYADVGQSVRAGARLGRLRRTSVGSNADESALVRETAERALRRTESLYERGFASQAALDDARLAVSRARDSATLTAPADGVILRRGAEPAQSVTPAQPIFVLGETASGLIVRAPMDSASAARIRVGDLAQIAVGAAAYAGRVSLIGAKSDDATGAFEVEIRLDAANGVRSGDVAQVRIAASGDAAQSAQAILVPTMSLIDARADQAVVLVVDGENIARRRSVQTGGVRDDGVLVIGGLAPGERVVSSGAAFVHDGEPVRIASASAN